MYFRENTFAAWLPTLPTMLCQPYISHHVVATFSVLAKQKNELFLKNLEHLVPNVLGEYMKFNFHFWIYDEEGAPSHGRWTQCLHISGWVGS